MRYSQKRISAFFPHYFLQQIGSFIPNFATTQMDKNINYMKRFFCTALLSMLLNCIIFPVSVLAADNVSYTVIMQKEPNNQTGHNKQESPEGRRIPPKPIYCTISPEGISVAGLSEDIITYEVWNETSEICLASFNEEQKFLDFLFNQSGEFQITFVTENYCISGYISI